MLYKTVVGLLQLTGTVVAILLLSFVITRLIPSDPARLALGFRADPQTLAQFRREHHLDRPSPVQLVYYFQELVHGNLGRSYIQDTPVVTLLARAARPTLRLATFAALITLLLVAMLIIFRNASPRIDQLFSPLMLVASSVPVFYLCFLLSWGLGYRLGWFPIAGYEPGWAGIRYLALPAFSMALMPAALLYRIIASNLDSAAEEPSFLAGRALGLPLSLLRNKYALRLSLVSAATVAGNILIMFLAGALFSEYAFSIPGIGLLTVNAIANGDVPLIQGTVLAGSLTYAASHFLTEVLYWLVDPRVRG